MRELRQRQWWSQRALVKSAEVRVRGRAPARSCCEDEDMAVVETGCESGGVWSSTTEWWRGQEVRDGGEVVTGLRGDLDDEEVVVVC